MVLRKQGMISPKESGLTNKLSKTRGGLVTRDNPDDFSVRGQGSKRTIIKYDNPDDVDI